MRNICAAAFCLLLIGCEAVPPYIVDLQHDKVVVDPGEDDYGNPNDLAAVLAEAQRGCAVHGRKAVPISVRSEVTGWYTTSRPIYNYSTGQQIGSAPGIRIPLTADRHLFACVD